MADRFKPPVMDWTTPGDLHTARFKIFKQKCELIFDEPLDETSEDKQTRLLLLWAGDKGLEIYNTTTWAQEEDSLKLGDGGKYQNPNGNRNTRHPRRCFTFLKKQNPAISQQTYWWSRIQTATQCLRPKHEI